MERFSVSAMALVFVLVAAVYVLGFYEGRVSTPKPVAQSLTVESPQSRHDYGPNGQWCSAPDVACTDAGGQGCCEVKPGTIWCSTSPNYKAFWPARKDGICYAEDAR
jgi:hypothetical protein